MLGVRPDATHDEIRRAYTERALRAHPDRLGDVSAAERGQAEWKMAELNLAWEVLRDPERRLAFDRASDRTSGAGVGPSPARGSADGKGEGSGQDAPALEPEIEGAPSVVRRRRWGVHAPLIVAALLVCLVGVVGCLAAVTSGPQGEDVETTERFPVGSCVSVAGDSTVTEAVCGDVGALRIVAREPFPRPCPTGTAALLVGEQDVSLCIDIPAAP